MQESKALFQEFEFRTPTDFQITEVNGIPLPEEYLTFMHKHNGGEGCIGKNLYVHLYPLEKLIKINTGYEINTYFPDCCIFGTNLGGDLDGFDRNGHYFSIDACSTDTEDMLFFGNTLMEFLQEYDTYMGEF